MTHDELRELVPIFALDALDGDEELEVRSHLEACQPCRMLLESHVQAAASLALAAEPVTPPAALRSRLMTAVAAPPPAPAFAPHAPLRPPPPPGAPAGPRPGSGCPRSSRGQRSWPWGHSAPASPAASMSRSAGWPS